MDHDPPPKYADDSKPRRSQDDDDVVDVAALPNAEYAAVPRPPIEYSSPGAFFDSVKRRLQSVLTRRFWLSLLAGQVVSLCITCTNVTTTELTQRNWSLPTTQTWFLCVVLPLHPSFAC